MKKNNENSMMAENENIDELVELLDAFAASQESRMKIDMSKEMKAGEVKKEYHHGRCDIGSPWACGTAFDVLEE